MLGIQVFVNSRDPHVQRGSMSEAAYWVGLRQEIYSALTNHVSIQVSLRHFTTGHPSEHLDDFSWANMAVIHCADVINFCFEDAGGSIAQWTKLKINHENWQQSKPLSFTPVYVKLANLLGNEAFPTIWYRKACHGKSAFAPRWCVTYSDPWGYQQLLEFNIIYLQTCCSLFMIPSFLELGEKEKKRTWR